MDQGLKERLIGAAILVALAVWLIPWVLDGGVEPEQQATTLELPVPEQAAPLRTHTIHLDAERSTPVPPASGAPRAETAAAPAPASAPVGAASAPRLPPAPAREPTVQSGAAAEAESDAPSTPAAVAAESEPVAAARSAEGGGSRGRDAAPTEQSATAPAPAAQGDWTVQLGSFGEEANARRLVERVAGYGYKAQISNVRANGRLLYRVRVGPHATRGQAEAAASALAAHGVPAQVVPLD